MESLKEIVRGDRIRNAVIKALEEVQRKLDGEYTAVSIDIGEIPGGSVSRASMTIYKCGVEFDSPHEEQWEGLTILYGNKLIPIDKAINNLDMPLVLRIAENLSSYQFKGIRRT